MKNKWPEWETPGDEEQLLLAKAVLPYIKILSPNIVKVIAEENNNKMQDWTTQLENLGIRADIYLWENSPVTFPGVRRHVGIEEINSFRTNPKIAKGNNALRLDDNSYPKELWSHTLRNCKYDKKNPLNYSLAHIIDHKDYNSKNRVELKGYVDSEDKNLFAGLFTSCANTIWVPNTFLKPTDHKGNIRNLLIQIVDKYYSSVCQILPHNLSFHVEKTEPRWTLDNFPEPTIVGNIDNIKEFIQSRNNFIDDAFTTASLDSGT